MPNSELTQNIVLKKECNKIWLIEISEFSNKIFHKGFDACPACLSGRQACGIGESATGGLGEAL